VKLAELKDSYPIEVAEFAKAEQMSRLLLGGYLVP
jgi:hypothetical protein